MVVSKLRESIQIAEELNKAFTDIEMVTMGTADATRELRQEYAELAVEMSGTVTQVANAANEWLRQGKTAQETTSLIKASMVMSRIGAIDSAEATEYLTSVLNGYKIEVQDVMHVVDAMSQVDIESASSVDDLAIALQRSASTASQAGVSFERLLGYVATVREVTQRSASVVGESFKTIFSRLGSVKAGTFLSEDLESEYTDIATYANDVEKVLSKIGIRLRDTNKDFRDAQDVLDDVAKGWANYDDLTKQALATAIAGTRQRENFLALMENYDKALKLEESALDSNGKAMQKYAIYQDSIAAKQDRITALFQTWVQEMNFEWLIGKLLSLGEALMKVFGSETAVAIAKITALIVALSKAWAAFTAIAGGAAITIGGIAPIAVGIAAAITAIVWAVDKFHKSTNDLRSDLQGLEGEIDQSKTAFENYSQQLQDNIDKIKELQDLIDKGTGGLVEQDEIDGLKEENKQLERQIALEKTRQENLKREAANTARELYSRGFEYQTYMTSSKLGGGLVKGGSIQANPDEIIDVAQKEIQKLQNAYDYYVQNNLQKAADDTSKAIAEKQKELTDTIVPQLEQIASAVDEQGNLLFQNIRDQLDAYYDSLMGYAEKFSSLEVEYPDAFSKFGKLIADNSEDFQAYLDGDDEALNEFADVLSGKANPVIYMMIQAAQAMNISLADLIRYLLNAASAGEELSDSISLETPASQVERFKDKVKSVVAAEEELAETGYVSADAAADLAKAYGEKVYDAMEWTGKGYKVNKESLEDLISSERVQYEIALSDAQNAAAAIVGANLDESASYKQKTADILAAIQAKKIELSLTARAGIHGKGPMGQEAQDAINALQELQKYEKEIAILQENLVNFDKTIEYLRGTSTSGKSKGETAYEREIRLLEHELYLSQQVADVYKGDNDEANYRAEVNKQLEIYLKLMEAAHAEAERLRKLGYAETSEEIQDLQQTWWGYYNARRDLADGLADWEKETTKSSIEDVKSAIDDLLDEAEDKLNEKLDDLEYRIKKNEAIKALHEAFFGILNDVADGLHEIDKELESSLSSVDYLDESLRNAMFNEDDYNKMSAKLKEIASDSKRLFDDYLNQLEMLTEDEIYKADYITSEFERQYKYKELEYDIAQKELELAKAQTKLQNVLMNRNVRMYKNGQWIWTADYTAVEEAKKAVRDAEYEKRDAEIKLKQQEVIDKYEGIIDNLKMQKDAANAEFDALKKMWERIQADLEDEEDAMTRLLKSINDTDIPAFKQIIAKVGAGLRELLASLGFEIPQVENNPYGAGTDFANEEKYLKNLIATGNYGQQEWAKAQLKLLYGTFGVGNVGDTGGYTADTNYANEEKYLNNLIATGNYGQREWAKAQLEKLHNAEQVHGTGSSGGGGSGGGGRTSGGGGGGTTPSGDSGKSNQQRYLENLVKTGNYGQKEWAKDQLNKGLYDSGGVLKGTGGIKATTKDEAVFGPELSSKILSPQKSKEFLDSANALGKMLDNSSAFSAMLNRFAGIVGGNTGVSNDSHDIYLSGNPLGNMTKSDSFALTSILRRYIPISGGGR